MFQYNLYAIIGHSLYILKLSSRCIIIWMKLFSMLFRISDDAFFSHVTFLSSVLCIFCWCFFGEDLDHACYIPRICRCSSYHCWFRAFFRKFFLIRYSIVVYFLPEYRCDKSCHQKKKKRKIKKKKKRRDSCKKYRT